MVVQQALSRLSHLHSPRALTFNGRGELVAGLCVICWSLVGAWQGVFLSESCLHLDPSRLLGK